MKIYLLSLILAFSLSFILMLTVLPLLKKLKAGQYILGYVKEHKSKSGTPTMGGIAFITSIIVIWLFMFGIDNGRAILTLAITGGYAIVGFLDDFLKISHKENEGLKPYQKIIFQVLIAIIAAAYCGVNNLTKLKIPFSGGYEFNLGYGIIPLVLFIFIATVNCVNLTDGLDGLAGGTSVSYLLILGIMLAVYGDSTAPLCFIGVGAICGFLMFNMNKASVFMGDTGSLALGGLISCVSIFSNNSLYIPIIGIMFVISGISVIVQVIYYKRTRRRVFLMAPIHHHFQMKGYTECKITYVYSLITALVGIFCLLFV